MKLWTWNVVIDTTQRSMARVMQAILLTDACMVGHVRLDKQAPLRLPLGKRQTVLIQIQIPDGCEAEFRRLAQPLVMQAPASLRFRDEPIADDGHPGRPR